MASTILSDNGVSSGSAGIKTTADGTGALALQTTTAGGAATTALTIDSSQNVGIGTSSPSSILNVKAASPIFRLETTAAVGSGGVAYNAIRDSTGADVFSYGYQGMANCFQFTTIPAAGFMRFLTGAQVEAMRIDSSGNLLFNSGYGSVATAYGCRAWVNFNGTGTVAIRGSGNVTSITDNGVGDYTVNFTTAMTDANYCPVTTLKPTSSASSTNGKVANIRYDTDLATGSCRVFCNSTGGAEDMDIVSVSIFR